MIISRHIIDFGYIPFCISVVLFMCSLAFATPQSERSNAKLRELLELELQMTQSRQALLKEESFTKQRSLIYEKLIALSCFENNPSKELLQACKMYHAELKKIFPDNVFLVCNKHKLQSEECASAFKQQFVLSVSDIEKIEKKDSKKNNVSLSKEQEYVDLQLKLEQYYRSDNATSLAKELKDNLRSLEMSSDPQEKSYYVKNVRSNYRKLIPLLCKRSQTIHTSMKPEENRSIYHHTQSTATKELADLVGALDINTTKEPDEQMSLYRIKVLSNACINILRESYNFDSSIPEVYCFHDDFNAPRCKHYRRKESLKNDMHTKKHKDNKIDNTLISF